MITVLLDKAEFEYDIHSLVKAFYPKEEVYVSTKDKEKKKSRYIITWMYSLHRKKSFFPENGWRLRKTMRIRPELQNV